MTHETYIWFIAFIMIIPTVILLNIRENICFKIRTLKPVCLGFHKCEIFDLYAIQLSY